MEKRRLAILVGGSLFVVAAGVVACGDDDNTAGGTSDSGTDSPTGTVDGSVVNTTDGTAPQVDGSTSTTDGSMQSADSGDAGVVRGPVKYLIPASPGAASPNGLFWQYGADPALYIADEGNDAILRWDDKKGFTKITAVPSPTDPDGGGLGAIVRLEDGTFFVSRFGFGLGGGVIYIAATGDAGYIPGIDVTRKRLGLAVLPDGTLVSTYFTGQGANTKGVVSKMTAFTGSEKDFITNLSKPVGVQYTEGRIVATDQNANYVVQSTALTIGGQFQDPLDGGPDAGGYDAGSIADSGLPDTLALLTGGDALCQGPDGSLFAASKAGTIYQIARDGTVTAVPGATGLVSTKGVAYDGANKRLFVGEIDTVNGSSIHIYPITTN